MKKLPLRGRYIVCYNLRASSHSIPVTRIKFYTYLSSTPGHPISFVPDTKRCNTDTHNVFPERRELHGLGVLGPQLHLPGLEPATKAALGEEAVVEQGPGVPGWPDRPQIRRARHGCGEGRAASGHISLLPRIAATSWPRVAPQHRALHAPRRLGLAGSTADNHKSAADVVECRLSEAEIYVLINFFRVFSLKV